MYTDKSICFKSNVVPRFLILPGMYINPTITMNSRTYSVVQIYVNGLPVYFSSLEYLFPFLTKW